MRPEELAHYIENQLRQGIQRDVLISNLCAGGWSKEQIEKAIIEHDKRLHKELRVKPIHWRIVFRVVLWIILISILIIDILFIIGTGNLNISSVL